MGNAKAVGLLCLVAVSGLGFAGEAAHAQTVVPFTLEAGHLVVVEGWIGRAGNLKLVIDTGASVTVISRRVAKALGLKGPAKRTAAFDKQVEVAEVRIPAVVIGELRIEQAPARIGPLEYTDLAEPVEIDALIGLDLLRVAAKTGLMIDYGSQTLTFGPVTHRAATKPFYKKLPLIPVSLSVRGKTLNLLLDTGYGELVLFGRAVEGRIAFRRTGETADIRTAGGKKRIEKVLLPEVRLAEQQWESFPAYVLDAAAPISRLDGVLGVRSLGLKRLCLDFDRGLMSWER